MVDLKNQALPRALSDAADLADLFQKELRMSAKAELSEKLSISGCVWIWRQLHFCAVCRSWYVATFGFATQGHCPGYRGQYPRCRGRSRLRQLVPMPLKISRRTAPFIKSNKISR